MPVNVGLVMLMREITRALATPGDSSFTYQLAGRLESGARLTSDPQLGRS